MPRKQVQSQLSSQGLVACRAVLVTVLCVWLALVLVGGHGTLQVWARLLVITTVVDGVVLAMATRSQWSAGSMSFLTLAVFHVGLYVAPAMTGRVPSFVVETGGDWFLRTDHQLLAGLIAIGLTAFALGCVCVRPWITMEDRTRLREDAGEREICRRYSTWGSALLILSVALWFMIGVSVGGTTFFLMSYRNYLTAVQGSLVGLTYIGIGLGLVFTVLNLRSFPARVAIGSFVVFSVVGFPLGLRGEVLMPIVGAVVIHMHLREKRPRWLLLIGSAVALSSITLAREVRKIGLGEGLSSLNLQLRPLNAVEELGASARVLSTSIDWHDNGGEAFLLGRTYYTFGLRILRNVVGVGNVDAWSDFGLMNVEIATRVGNIGGSLLGEAHHNFGLVGVLFVPFLFGWLLAVSARNAVNAHGLAVLGVAVVLLIMHVRNTFGPLLIWGVVAAVVIALASHPLRTRSAGRVFEHQ